MQTNQDIANRSIPGTFIYVVVWFCIAYLLNAPSQSSEDATWIHSISMLIVATSLTRIALIHLAKRYLEQTGLSQGLLVVGMIISSLSWGLMASFAFLDTPLSEQKDLIFLATIGLSGGGSLSFCASRMFTRIFLTCMLLPIFVVEVFIVDSMDLAAVMIVTIYFLGLLSATKQPYREYLSSLISYLKLEEISNTDALTEIRNRRFFDNQINEEVRRARRNQSSLSLLLLDADHFKQINDRYGHPVGDKCLIHLAKQLQRSFHRVRDTVARFGGEEFAIILPNIAESECAEIAEKLREEIAASPVMIDQQAIRLTVSIGCVSVSHVSNDVSSEQLISKADEALYEAKRLGRDRVESANI